MFVKILINKFSKLQAQELRLVRPQERRRPVFIKPMRPVRPSLPNRRNVYTGQFFHGNRQSAIFADKSGTSRDKIVDDFQVYRDRPSCGRLNGRANRRGGPRKTNALSSRRRCVSRPTIIRSESALNFRFGIELMTNIVTRQFAYRPRLKSPGLS